MLGTERTLFRWVQYRTLCSRGRAPFHTRECSSQRGPQDVESVEEVEGVETVEMTCRNQKKRAGSSDWAYRFASMPNFVIRKSTIAQCILKGATMPEPLGAFETLAPSRYPLILTH